MQVKIGVVGLGYVGAPLALAFARKFPGTVGFDVNKEKVKALRAGQDVNHEGWDQELRSTNLLITSNPNDLKGSNFFVVAVPTPLDGDKRPDLVPLLKACGTVGACLGRGAVVVFESTVYPGVTEEICGPLLAKVSGLEAGKDFKLGYSPERINPGDREHTLERITKVVSGEDEETLALVAEVYGSIIPAGVHRAGSIKVAEAAKVIENTQRDLNIALMNELAIIFDLLQIPTREVLKAAGTKWNFMPFTPGLVGGHCIGVDPYYLTTKAEQIGYRPQVILAGRRINDNMGKYVAQRALKLMINGGINIKGCRIGVFGITFKENVADVRNSRVPDIIGELKEYGVDALVHDPLADPADVREEYGIVMSPLDEMKGLDGLILAVMHNTYRELGARAIASRIRPGGVLADVKGGFDPHDIPEGVTYWSL
jgi:UDP-N-acetyl-D-glucosamine/UDP-N-acetyl-D-galactosamine dehydrogenase